MDTGKVPAAITTGWFPELGRSHHNPLARPKPPPRIRPHSIGQGADLPTPVAGS